MNILATSCHRVIDYVSNSKSPVLNRVELFLVPIQYCPHTTLPLHYLVYTHHFQPYKVSTQLEVIMKLYTQWYCTKTNLHMYTCMCIFGVEPTLICSMSKTMYAWVKACIHTGIYITLVIQCNPYFSREFAYASSIVLL